MKKEMLINIIHIDEFYVAKDNKITHKKSLRVPVFCGVDWEPAGLKWKPHVP